MLFYIVKFTYGFIIIVVYIDNLNIIGTSEKVPIVIEKLKEEFEIKSPGRKKFCFGL